MPQPPKKQPATPRDYERAAAPLDAPPAPLIVWALAIIPTKHLGQPEHSIVMLEVRGTESSAPSCCRDSNHDRMELALQDFRRATPSTGSGPPSG